MGAAVALGAWVLAVDTVPGERRVLIRVHDAGLSIDQAMLAISRATELLPLGAVAVGVLVVLLVLHRPSDAMLFGAGVAVVWAVNPLLKELVGRSRPDLWPLPDSVSEYSFPSGHAANTAALAGGLLLILHSRHWRVVGALLAAVGLAIVGFSQLVLGRHYPSDILAGWFWAGAWISLLAWVRSRRSEG
ncbi:phosphatase PAP2 family protein [Kribbella catacumbae]|uniref:phosphatase PAP2 family protein n=1 Tax=Kribbella catacumbae TaxID=460086 RepID=UPI00036DA7E2|nr:phosphatase PAP2 family protein [Kribbella catacumbae]